MQDDQNINNSTVVSDQSSDDQTQNQTTDQNGDNSNEAVIANDPELVSEEAEQSEQIATEQDAPHDDKNEPEEPPVAEAKNANPNARWYVVHTYSGHENKVAATLKQRIESERLEDKIIDVLVPVQDKIEIKGGKKISIKEKIFPGYILVKMELEDTTWLAVRTIQGVTSFVGIGNKPTPISESEVQTIVKFTQTEQPVYKQVFTINDAVKIVEGPFADFIGKVDHIDEEKGKVKVLVSIFGRETPVELDFLQVQKI